MSTKSSDKKTVSFNLENFISTNKRLLIWTAFFFLLYLIRPLFGLVFLTYILCFIFNNLITKLTRSTPLPRRLWTVIVYLVFVTVVILALFSIIPKLGTESKHFILQIPQTLDKFHAWLDSVGDKQPYLAPLLARAKDSISVSGLGGLDKNTLLTILMTSLNQITHYSSFFLLGTLFSFFILFDFPNLKERTMALRETRLKQAYELTADSVAKFALVVGAAFQAQIFIAMVNTLLTAIGLWMLGIRPIVLLCTIVFFSGLIPVLGVFISSVPILLLSFNTGGIKLTLASLIMIVIVHIVEAYVLNPRILSAIFKINPVLTLIILYIGHSLFGIWGVILGVPISVYIYRHAILGR